MSSNFEELVKRDPSTRYFNKQHWRRQELVFVTYQGIIKGVIEEILKYELKLAGRDELLKKHDILFLYKPDASEDVDRFLKTDEEVAEQKLEPVLLLTERLKIPVKDLNNLLKKKTKIGITLRSGHLLTGKIHSFGIFSIRLKLAWDCRVIIMRPNIYNVDYSLEDKPVENLRGNVKTLVFHSSGCRYFNCEDCTQTFSSRDEAVKAGFRPHKQCS